MKKSAVKEEVLADVFDELSFMNWKTALEIAKVTGHSSTDVRKVLKFLYKEGELEMSDKKYRYPNSR